MLFFSYFLFFCLLVNTTAYLNVTVSNPTNATNASINPIGNSPVSGFISSISFPVAFST